MKKYFQSLSGVIFMSLVGSQVLASDIREESASKPVVRFTSFVYNPNTKKFEGNFFQEADNVFSQLGGFYTARHIKIKKKDLPHAQEDLKTLNIRFEPEELERYKALKKQEGEILLQDAAVVILEVTS